MATAPNPDRDQTFTRQARLALTATLLLLALGIMYSSAMAQVPERSGKEVVDASCAACHRSGTDGAPQIGDKKAWQKRAAGGMEKLTRSALQGAHKMPAHSTHPLFTESEIRGAIVYMMDETNASWTAPVSSGE
jgi:cytochrome c5